MCNSVSDQILFFDRILAYSEEILKVDAKNFESYVKSSLHNSNVDEKLHKHLNNAWYVQEQNWKKCGFWKGQLERESPFANIFNFHPHFFQIC